MEPKQSFGYKGVGLGEWIIVLQLFLYIASPYIYGPFAAQVQTVYIAYFILLAVPLAAFNVPLPSLRASTDQLYYFLAMFIATSFISVVLFSFAKLSGVLGSFETVKLAIGYGLLHGFVKAFDEEVIFRSLLPNSGMGIFVSNILFGVFHLAAVTVTQGIVQGIKAMAVLFILGLIWSQIYRRYGLYGSVGSHFAYNLAVLGILPILFGIQTGM